MLKSIFNTIYFFIDSILLSFLILIYFIITIILSALLFFSPNKSEKISYFREKFLSKKSYGTITWINLINLSAKNLSRRRSRVFVTITGLSIAFAVIVFLISIGFGLQNLIVERISSVQETTLIETYPQAGGLQKISDESIVSIQEINGVEKVMPIIAVAGKVKFQNAEIDVVAYGVQGDLIKETSKKLGKITGKIFENNLTSVEPISFPVQEIKGLETVTLEELLVNSGSELKQLKINSTTPKEAVINKAMAAILGLNESNFTNQELSAKFVVPPNLLEDENSKIESLWETYIIVGIVEEQDNPFFYVPFVDLRSIGITYYSQLKVKTESEGEIKEIREKISSMGYSTTSVLDTLGEIDNIFSIIRTVSFLFGLMALFVGILGMFNTVTVSLLEKTKEVGLMKAIGMKNKEVKRLFLTESLIMSFIGAFLGTVSGYLAGKVASGVISNISSSGEYIEVAYINGSLILLICLIAVVTGMATGIYPGRRASKISALDALRYE